MKNLNFLYSLLFLIAFSISGNFAFAGDTSVSTLGAGGYDLVSYQNEKPEKGSGFHQSVYKGVTYIFANEENKKKFDEVPHKYLPAYGGYCAYGASVGRKFVASPEVWKIVDGTLYFNLDEKIQKKWEEDLQGNIAKADELWPTIKNK